MMSFHSALAAVQESKEYKEFKKKNKGAILFSAFFTLNPEFELETQQIDYFIPKIKKIRTFFVNADGTINSKQDELQEKKGKIEELDTNVKDIGFIITEIKKQITDKPNKIILILQHHKDKEIWNVTCILESFKILNLHFDAFAGKTLLKEERNIFDFMQVKKKGG